MNMGNFMMPDGYVQRAVLEDDLTTYIGYSKLDEPDSGSWMIKKIVEDTYTTRIYYGEGAWSDVLTLTYR